ncbi:MAG: hypothetical protein Greene041619_115 [Candidatus Peregrinibacteria bacterium Greene0416_19]|nr:MAG: hypothetical protein Greene041619_115 [Candidatus Peregrinibacteria bacterium Greene0416_19]
MNLFVGLCGVALSGIGLLIGSRYSYRYPWVRVPAMIMAYGGLPVVFYAAIFVR